ncbi:uncharacterized protein DUF4126 [Haloactinospora alba]|uniref:Uncharacterized protein DUF4126 n=1 Tax=Haloactinospora alba TaxID=405555 RepID=A0A543NKQ4_9ACTN|nr:DUF4126 domain-containing protein [Haloactinospora alba]TQN32428.1 uncharacterized protein DUF4126 [Haloactinospora alba]
MLAALTGTGLSAAAGINAYIPLLLLGALARFTDLVQLGSGWQWLEHPAALGTVGALLTVEFAADKVPVADSVNDAVQTFVRPTSGGVTFGAGASSVALEDMATAGDAVSGDGSFGSVAAGVVIALALHAVKSLARPLINTATLGSGGAVASLVEDASSLSLAVLAILVPIAILLFVPVFVFLVWWLLRLRGKRKRARANRNRVPTGPGPHQP